MVAYTVELNDDNYTEFVSKPLSLVDIWAPWCGPCKIIGPVIDEISSDYKGKLSVGKLNADESRERIGELGIRNIPTILLYKDGEIVEKFVGAVPKYSITEAIDRHL